MNKDELLVVDEVGKKFCRDLKKSLFYGVQDILGECLPGISRPEELREQEFWAVGGVSFSLKRGECLGLIGHNGAGKTTLLKMLNGLIKPDRGQIDVEGRVGALIALGAGFNPVLTGRENIFVNAAVLGMTRKETESCLDEIIDFADIGEFLDAPVQSYSSGMQVRLGFAVASQLKPDILLVDEVLAVGDLNFRLKCYRRIRDMKTNGTAIILVSHNMSDICNVCDTAILMEKGKIRNFGNPDSLTLEYEQSLTTVLSEKDGEGLKFDHSQEDSPVLIESVRLMGEDKPSGLQGHVVSTQQDIELDLGVRYIRIVPNLHLSFALRNAAHVLYFGERCRILELIKEPGNYRVKLKISAGQLLPGIHLLSVGLSDGNDVGGLLQYIQQASVITITGRQSKAKAGNVEVNVEITWDKQGCLY